MQKMQKLLTDPEKTASDHQDLESRLQEVRNKIAEIDGA